MINKLIENILKSASEYNERIRLSSDIKTGKELRRMKRKNKRNGKR